jgi:hypothetical protein
LIHLTQSPVPQVGRTPFAARGLWAGILAVAVAATALVAPSPTLGFGGDGLRAAANAVRVNGGVLKDGTKVAGGLLPVAGTALLDDIATKRASQMATAGKLEHDLTYVVNRLNASGACWSSVGEIIAWARGYPSYSYERTLDQWLNSRGHREILMGSGYNAAGGAWQRTSDTSDYSVMIFVRLCGSDVPSTLSSGSLAIATPYAPVRRVYFAGGDHTGYQLTETGAVVGTKTYRLGRPSSAPAAGRTYVAGRAYLRITSGVWAGYWIRETSRSYVMGVAWSATYASPRTIYFSAGKYTGYKYDGLGHVVARRTYTLGRSSSAPASGIAVINGRTHFQVSGGIWAGYWVPHSSGMRLPS